MKKPRVSRTYWVCCSCLQCRAEINGPFMFFWGSRTKKDSLKELKQKLEDHSKHCFLAQEVTTEIPVTRQTTTKKRKAA